MKTPDHIIINLQPENQDRVQDKKYRKLWALNEVPSSRSTKKLFLRVRFSKHHYRYHTYEVTGKSGYDITLEKKQEK